MDPQGFSEMTPLVGSILLCSPPVFRLLPQNSRYREEVAEMYKRSVGPKISSLKIFFSTERLKARLYKKPSCRLDSRRP